MDDVPNYYVVIISNGDIVVESSKLASNEIYKIISLIIDEIKVGRDRGYYGNYQQVKYLYDVYDDYYFILVCDPDIQLRIGLSLLEHIRKDFFNRFIIQNQRLYRAKYREWLNEESNFYLNNPDADKLKGIIVDIEEIKHVMSQNMEKVAMRGAKLENLNNQTAAMEDDANILFRNSKRLKRRKCCKYYCCCFACFASCFPCL